MQEVAVEMALLARAKGQNTLRLKEQIMEFDRMIMVWHRSNETSKRLHYIPELVRCWQPLWSPALLTPGPSDQDALEAFGF